MWIWLVTIIESLGLSQSNLVDYFQFVGKILIQGFGCYEHFTIGRSDRYAECIGHNSAHKSGTLSCHLHIS